MSKNNYFDTGVSVNRHPIEVVFLGVVDPDREPASEKIHIL